MSQPTWYAVRVSYSRELALKAILDEKHIESFIPMRHEYGTKNGKRTHKLVPAIHNLVFIHSTRPRIEALKKELEISIPIRFIMNREYCRPVVIPDSQMRSFIAVSGNYEEQIVYLDPIATALQKGDRVRVIGGIFEGVEGVIIRVKGDRRVSVCIQGVMAVATAYIHPSLIERISDSSL